MTWTEQFAWGFLGSMAVEIVTLFRLLQKAEGQTTLPARYRSVLYWVVRCALAAVGGGLAVAYDIASPILAANIGAATPAIVMALTRDPATSASNVATDTPTVRGHAAVRARHS